MHKVTRDEWKKTKKQCGGDLWNKSKLLNLAFNKYPEAESIEYSIGTGLWVDIDYTTKEGEVKTGRINDGLDDHYARL